MIGGFSAAARVLVLWFQDEEMLLKAHRLMYPEDCGGDSSATKSAVLICYPTSDVH